MEVDHEAMKRTAEGSASTPVKPNNDPAAAPEMVETSTSQPVMSFRSGAVPDQYESYPEVVPPQGAPEYPPPAHPQSAVSPVQSSSPYDRYQNISPPPPQQHQPLMQNVQNQQYYNNGPIPVDSEKKGYFVPPFGTTGPTQPPGPYGPTGPVGVDSSNSGSSYGKPVTAPPPVAEGGVPGEKKILGLKKKTFWIVLVVVILVIAGAAGGAAGAIISNNNKKKNNTQNDEPVDPILDNDDRGNTTTGGSSGGYTPFALSTGVRTLDLTYLEDSGSCNPPSNPDSGGLVNCFQSSRYQVRIDGSVSGGYFLSSVNVQGSTFSNIAGSPPTTDDPNVAGGAWLFEVTFSEGTTCDLDRITRYAFGKDDSVYAVGE
ncbi:hypothetical protein ABW19_dt0206352 [Dactylella cylindrospora]|nr:hypothetical protein ABW19_dt0206352 [Dactylella cylindrospora]